MMGMVVQLNGRPETEAPQPGVTETEAPQPGPEIGVPAGTPNVVE